ncbi:hypothetical protein ACFJIV_11275 [Mucilaginibacter sp. UC70_90]
MPAGDTIIKLPPVKQTITHCRVLHGKKVKFHQDTAGINLDMATVKLDSLVTTLELKTRGN